MRKFYQPKDFMDGFDRFKQLQDDLANKALDNKRYTETQIAALQTQEVIAKSFKVLVDYLDKRVSKTNVVNQLREIGTPDALKVVGAVESLHETLKTHENTDLSEVTSVMKQMLTEVQKIPKENIELPEQKFVDYSKQFSGLEQAIKSVEKVVKAQKLIAEAPIVNLPETVVNVPEVDLKPLQDGLKSVVKAVNDILIPEYKTDNTEVEKLIKKSNDLLKKLLDKPVGGGGGGGGRATPYEDSSGNPQFVTLVNGKVPVDVDMATEGIATEATLAKMLTPIGNTFDYIGISNVGDTDTLVYKSGGAGGTTVKTLSITFAAGAEKVSDSITSLEYS